ncbi:MAG: hypothetical protein IPO61_22280 [Gammaproteobacteria bacterium]|nr:hypothetical protein [Gammaproteobacteria bacterium]
MASRISRHSAGEHRRRLLLAALRLGPVTTLNIREQVNVIHPAARVLELRERGYRIVTTWTHEPDAWGCGLPHRIARYALARQARRVEA